MESHHSHVTIQPCMFSPQLIKGPENRSDVISNKPPGDHYKEEESAQLHSVTSTLFWLFDNNTQCHPHQKFEYSFHLEKKKKKHNNFNYGHRNKNNTSNIYEMFQKTKLINTKHKKTFIKYNFSPFTVW